MFGCRAREGVLGAVVLCVASWMPPKASAQERDEHGKAPAEGPAPVSPTVGDGQDLHLRAETEAVLRQDIARLRLERSEISQTGPVVMMIVGYVLAPLVLVGVPMLLIGKVCDADRTDCVDLAPAGLVLTGVGLAGGAVGIAGLVMALERSDERRRLADEIEDRERDLQSLSYRIAVGPDHATLELRWSL